MMLPPDFNTLRSLIDKRKEENLDPEIRNAIDLLIEQQYAKLQDESPEPSANVRAAQYEQAPPVMQPQEPQTPREQEFRLPQDNTRAPILFLNPTQKDEERIADVLGGGSEGDRGFDYIKTGDGGVEKRTSAAAGERLNNPGNLQAGNFTARNGAVGSGGQRSIDPNGRFAAFPTEQEGMAALNAWWADPGKKDWTISQAIHAYAPAHENDTASYEKSLGIAPGTTLGKLSKKQIQDLTDRVHKAEGRGVRVDEKQIIPGVGKGEGAEYPSEMPTLPGDFSKLRQAVEMRNRLRARNDAAQAEYEKYVQKPAAKPSQPAQNAPANPKDKSMGLRDSRTGKLVEEGDINVTSSRPAGAQIAPEETGYSNVAQAGEVTGDDPAVITTLKPDDFVELEAAGEGLAQNSADPTKKPMTKGEYKARAKGVAREAAIQAAEEARRKAEETYKNAQAKRDSTEAERQKAKIRQKYSVDSLNAALPTPVKPPPVSNANPDSVLKTVKGRTVEAKEQGNPVNTPGRFPWAESPANEMRRQGAAGSPPSQAPPNPYSRQRKAPPSGFIPPPNRYIPGEAAPNPSSPSPDSTTSPAPVPVDSSSGSPRASNVVPFTNDTLPPYLIDPKKLSQGSSASGSSQNLASLYLGGYGGDPNNLTKSWPYGSRENYFGSGIAPRQRGAGSSEFRDGAIELGTGKNNLGNFVTVDPPGTFPRPTVGTRADDVFTGRTSTPPAPASGGSMSGARKEMRFLTLNPKTGKIVAIEKNSGDEYEVGDYMQQAIALDPRGNAARIHPEVARQFDNVLYAARHAFPADDTNPHFAYVRVDTGGTTPSSTAVAQEGITGQNIALFDPQIRFNFWQHPTGNAGIAENGVPVVTKSDGTIRPVTLYGMPGMLRPAAEVNMWLSFGVANDILRFMRQDVANNPGAGNMLGKRIDTMTGAEVEKAIGKDAYDEILKEEISHIVTINGEEKDLGAYEIILQAITAQANSMASGGTATAASPDLAALLGSLDPKSRDLLMKRGGTVNSSSGSGGSQEYRDVESLQQVANKARNRADERARLLLLARESNGKFTDYTQQVIADFIGKPGQDNWVKLQKADPEELYGVFSQVPYFQARGWLNGDTEESREESVANILAYYSPASIAERYVSKSNDRYMGDDSKRKEEFLAEIQGWARMWNGTTWADGSVGFYKDKGGKKKIEGLGLTVEGTLGHNLAGSPMPNNTVTNQANQAQSIKIDDPPPVVGGGSPKPGAYSGTSFDRTSTTAYTTIQELATNALAQIPQGTSASDAFNHLREESGTNMFASRDAAQDAAERLRTAMYNGMAKEKADQIAADPNSWSLSNPNSKPNEFTKNFVARIFTIVRAKHTQPTPPGATPPPLEDVADAIINEVSQVIYGDGSKLKKVFDGKFTSAGLDAATYAQQTLRAIALGKEYKAGIKYMWDKKAFGNMVEAPSNLAIYIADSGSNGVSGMRSSYAGGAAPGWDSTMVQRSPAVVSQAIVGAHDAISSVKFTDTALKTTPKASLHPTNLASNPHNGNASSLINGGMQMLTSMSVLRSLFP